MSDQVRGRHVEWLRRAFIEAPIIVGSILLAFSIDATWDRWKERSEVREILEGLEVEYLEHQERYEWRIDGHRARLGELALLMSGVAALELGVERVDRAIYRLLIVGTVDPGRGIRDALVSSGRLELIRNAELRMRLATWESFVEEVHENQELMRRQVESAIVPYLAAEGLPLSGALSVGAPTSHLWPSPLEWPDQTIPSDGVEATYRRVLADTEFQSYLAITYTWLAWTIGELQTAHEEVQWILGTVQAELRDM